MALTDGGPAGAPLGERLWDLARSRPALALFKALDAWVLGPVWASACRSLLPEPGAPRLEGLLKEDGPIHWLRPGGMGDWAVLAPFIQGVRSRRSHPEDTLWVTEAALPFAERYHAQDGLRVRPLSPAALWASPPPLLVVQTELFHPTAWLLAALLRPRWAAGHPPGDPRRLEGLPGGSMVDLFARLHPGVAVPARAPRPCGDRILVFAQGNHPSRRLPPGTGAALAAAGLAPVDWHGPWEDGPLPATFRHFPEPRPIPLLWEALREARAVLSPDSGPFHLAGLLGLPALGYFTSGERDRWGWTGPGRAVLATGFSCGACTRFALPAPCPHAFACVHAPDRERLVSALAALLG